MRFRFVTFFQLAFPASLFVLTIQLGISLLNADEVSAEGQKGAEVDRPKVIEVSPPDGSKGVDAVTEIRVRFDRPMTASQAEIGSNPSTPASFHVLGPSRYDSTKHEFTFAVRLTPGTKHEFAINDRYTSPAIRKRMSRMRRSSRGFFSAERVCAEPFYWSFTTAPAEPPPAGEPPQVQSVDPPPDTEVALYTILKVQFDRPMDPDFYGIKFADRSLRLGRIRTPGLQEPTTYEPKSHQFKLPVVFPANWNGEFSLVNFRSADGAVVQPKVLSYRTLREPMLADLKSQIEESGKSEELRRILEKVIAKNQSLKSVSYEVALSQSHSRGSYRQWSAYFHKQGDRFHGDVSEGMQSAPFEIGCDGKVCWFRHKDSVIQSPAAQIVDKRVNLCRPFGADSAEDIDQLIGDFQLETLGEVQVDGRRQSKIRSWRRASTGRVTDYFFDSETLMLSRMESNGSQAIFKYKSINEDLPPELFRVPSDKELVDSPLHPLEHNENRRFVLVADGSHGAVLLRWGQKGPSGTRSGGMSWNW